MLGGVMTLSAAAEADVADWGDDLYRDAPAAARPKLIRCVPYYAWDNRASGEMRVWLRSR